MLPGKLYKTNNRFMLIRENVVFKVFVLHKQTVSGFENGQGLVQARA
jgi:hypothetical protein